MEAIAFLTTWISYLLYIVPVGAGTTVAYFAVSKMFSLDEEQKNRCDLRIRQTIKGAIIVTSIGGIVTLIRTFY